MGIGVLFNLISAGADFQKGDVTQETFATVGDAAQQLGNALIGITHAERLGQFGGAAASTFTKFVERITPGLGVLCTTASLRTHIEQTGGDGAIGAYIGALGDSIALVGVLAESFGVTAPLAAIITGLGFTLSFLGDMIHDWLAAEAIVAEERQFLGSSGVDAALAAVLVRVNAKHMQEWAANLHYDAPRLQWLAGHAPETLTSRWFSGLKVDGFKNLVKDLGYATDGGFALLQAIPNATTESRGAHGPSCSSKPSARGASPTPRAATPG